MGDTMSDTTTARPEPVRLTDLAGQPGGAGGACGTDRAPAQTIREAAVRLGAHDSSTPEIQRALDLLERECYGAEPLSETEIDAAVTAFGSLVTA